jgi:hypothetical protein
MRGFGGAEPLHNLMFIACYLIPFFKLSQSGLDLLE